MCFLQRWGSTGVCPSSRAEEGGKAPSPPKASLGDRPPWPALPAHGCGSLPLHRECVRPPQTSKPSLSALSHYFFHFDGGCTSAGPTWPVLSMSQRVWTCSLGCHWGFPFLCLQVGDTAPSLPHPPSSGAGPQRRIFTPFPSRLLILMKFPLIIVLRFLGPVIDKRIMTSKGRGKSLTPS